MKRLGLIAGSILVGCLGVIGLLALLWTPYDPTHIVPSETLRGPSSAHWLGTDRMGIDLVSRLMVGARVCLEVGVIAVSIAAVIGVPLGIFAAMKQGWVDELIMRLTDVMYAFPALLLAILLASALGASTATAMVAIGVSSIPAFARVTRSSALPVVASDYVLAARSSGTRPLKIALRHVLPNVTPTIGVQASVSFGIAILAEAGLSYLGVGGSTDVPTWGRMLYDARDVMYTHPYQAVLPGLAIALAVMGFNLLGDGLRDLLDPRLKEVR
ncbi:MAG: ABC transporter permease [Propionibacteriaceae bacterium]